MSEKKVHVRKRNSDAHGARIQTFLYDTQTVQLNELLWQDRNPICCAACQFLVQYYNDELRSVWMFKSWPIFCFWVLQSKSLLEMDKIKIREQGVATNISNPYSPLMVKKFYFREFSYFEINATSNYLFIHIWVFYE